MATVETLALRAHEWVKPNHRSLNDKIRFMKTYWPNIELVGTFHSHPYDSPEEARYHVGWTASDGDLEFFEDFHWDYEYEQPTMAHLIIAMAQMQRCGWASPNRLPGARKNSGYSLSIDSTKVWIKSYATFHEIPEEEGDVPFIEIPTDDVYLDIPSIHRLYVPYAA